MYFEFINVGDNMKVLVACEESQRVCTAFRAKGHEAYSCDVVDCSGNHPEWHIKADVLPLLNGNCSFVTCDGVQHDIKGQWDMIIAFPPCTYLTNAGTRSFSLKCTPADKVVKRWDNRAKAAIFFMHFALANCDKICVENPVGYMSTNYRKPDQIINPYQFAESECDCENYVLKRTCLWLKGLPKLHTNNLPIPLCEKYYSESYKGLRSKSWVLSTTTNRSFNRSKTFPGVAKAMAEQWG